MNTMYKIVCGRPNAVTQGESLVREKQWTQGYYNIWKSGKKEQSAE